MIFFFLFPPICLNALSLFSDFFAHMKKDDDSALYSLSVFLSLTFPSFSLFSPSFLSNTFFSSHSAPLLPLDPPSQVLRSDDLLLPPWVEHLLVHHRLHAVAVHTLAHTVQPKVTNNKDLFTGFFSLVC